MTSSPDTLTQCPHCQTRFHVTDKQLSAARGKVRCGHCLQVFNALEHALAEETGDSSSETPDEEDDLVFDDNPEEDAEEGRYAGHKYHAHPEEDEFNEALLRMEKGETPDFYDAIDDEEDSQVTGADESWAESLLADDETEPSARAGGDDYDLPDPSPLESERASLAEPEPARMSKQSRTPPTDNTAPGEPEPDQPRKRTTREEPVWANLNSQPIQPPRPDRSSMWRRILWPVGGLVAAALLVYQLGWVHFDRLALYEPVRPWYASLCEWTGCELPPLQAVDRIKSRELVVRSHPDEDNALLLEVTLVNEAGFKQPYPAIALSFSNLNNDVVAQRVFQPEDYLGDPETARQAMPPGQGRRIRLALRDPGKDAINYRIDLMAAP